ncbi:MAG: PD-(D/E)XK nuclease family protein [Longibaculum sp.]
MSKGSRTIELTTSQVNLFKDCRRHYEFSYKEMLKPVNESEALEVGTSYHEKVEEIIKTGDFERTGDKTDAMANAFKKYILPQLGEIVSVEEEFRERISRGIYLKGKIDARGNDCLIEHKTTGQYIDDKYMYRVNFFNDQVSNYLIAKGINQNVKYTVIVKPTIRQTKKETLDEFLERCESWYEEDTDKKIAVFDVYRTDEELAEQKNVLIQIAKEIKKGIYYRNEKSCLILGCPFLSICKNYDSSIMPIDFIKKEKVNEELRGEF